MKLKHTLLCLCISISLCAQVIEDTIPQRNLLNVGLGFGGTGVSAFPDSGQKISIHVLRFTPSVGYFVTKDVEVGLLGEVLFRRSNVDSISQSSGLGLGYYGRYNLTRFNPLGLLIKKHELSSFFFIELEHQISNIRYGANEFGGISFARSMNIQHFKPKLGFKLGLYQDKLFVNFNFAYHLTNGFKPISNIPVTPGFAIEYFFKEKAKPS